MTSEQSTRRLDTPRVNRRPSFHVDSDLIGMYAERIARFLGTGRYLAIQTVIVIVWIIINLSWVALRFDPYPFILLNLAFSTQAAYAAPLILLAQNRQENRDRVALDEDRARAAQTKADTEFLARARRGPPRRRRYRHPRLPAKRTRRHARRPHRPARRPPRGTRWLDRDREGAASPRALVPRCA